ncbi:hypothetical protein PHET_09567 [Paragonimus heterotremus]|uniref:DUF4795 domain-containing protein n=1 Tax=Paragonimus heterotremus TaxID=100268 RepID=A0A8J4WEP0_9TREM|nr:hypothetical protein PHET_09567 [Paragonimus heterotremus]
MELSDLVGRPEFVDVNREVHKLIEDLFSKLTLSEEEIRNLINALEEGLQVKLDRDEFDQLREWLEKRFKALAVRVRSIHSVSPVMGVPPVTQISDEAAGLRRGLMQHYHCISCDRPLQIPIGLE